ncbi:unnamed protein product [Musa acuminata var. zebrina]
MPVMQGGEGDSREVERPRLLRPVTSTGSLHTHHSTRNQVSRPSDG